MFSKRIGHRHYRPLTFSYVYVLRLCLSKLAGAFMYNTVMRCIFICIMFVSRDANNRSIYVSLLQFIKEL